jgi:hypothetical protein
MSFHTFHIVQISENFTAEGEKNGKKAGRRKKIIKRGESSDSNIGVF